MVDVFSTEICSHSQQGNMWILAIRNVVAAGLKAFLFCVCNVSLLE